MKTGQVKLLFLEGGEGGTIEESNVFSIENLSGKPALSGSSLVNKVLKVLFNIILFQFLINGFMQTPPLSETGKILNVVMMMTGFAFGSNGAGGTLMTFVVIEEKT